MATKRQIAKAARLWGLSLIAHMDCGHDYVGEDDPVLKVRMEAISAASDKLRQLGFEPGQLLNEDDCLRAVGA